MLYREDEILKLKYERDVAIRILAEWVCAVDRNGTSVDDWGECYKDAKYRDNMIRELMNKEIEQVLYERCDETQFR